MSIAEPIYPVTLGQGPDEMITAGLLFGGVVGMGCALIAVLVAGASWGFGIAIYFLAGYGVPLLLFCLARLACAMISLRRGNEARHPDHFIGDM